MLQLFIRIGTKRRGLKVNKLKVLLTNEVDRNPLTFPPSLWKMDGTQLLFHSRGEISTDTLCDWYEYRAKEIERLSRQADCALELINFGTERHVQV